MQKAPHDCVALEYAGGDKLYVPVENIDILSRYGSESDGVALDRLGGEAWQRRKSRMKERIREIAGELIKTAAERALRPGPVAEPDTGYAAFSDRFPFEETEDQDRAIDDVVADLAKGRPMDRLVCGDVGFGKTEVALRAAFVAAMSGLQVALIAPTTLLARQHFQNFKERFQGFPIEIGRLSRLVPAKEMRSTKERLKAGKVDIVIGTHALLAKSVEFRKLGLVIVDEEQRFGVAHKEKLKALRSDVHVLTLTATPIPRTLQMAMSGLRELSVIQTPPVDRLAVRTYVMPWDPVVVREALLREHYRGGQSFFVVPRIADLPDIEKFLREEVPEVRYVVAHGQMAATEVEERMSAFYDRRYEVLLSTTIVESGLDIPSANTLIVHRADRFGLAQLYQLRGRVGRAKIRAYAYFATPTDRLVTETADKRLQVLASLETLGAGFELATHDLDIRGAGNLLGDEQSGHIKEVGFELYQSMLEEAILEAKSGGLAAPRDAFSPQITVDAPILISEDYVPDLDLRMGLYRRMNELDSVEEIESFAAEMIDRFGKLPPEAENLLKVIEIKLNCRKAEVAKLDVGPKGALVHFHNDAFPDLEGLLAYVQRLKGTARLRPDSKLVITRAWPDSKARLNGALQLSKGWQRLSADRRGGAFGHMGDELGDVERRRAEEALVERAAFLGEQGQLLLCLDPFGDDVEAERTGHVDDASHNDPVPGRAGDVLAQPLVDLEIVERQRLQIGKARIAGAEIVDGRAKAAAAQLGEQGGRAGKVLDQPAFGHLDGQPLGRKAAFPDERKELVGEARLADVGGGDVDRKAKLAERLRPGRRGGDRPALHMVGQLGEIIGSFGDAEQGGGAELAILGMPPAGERLDPGDLAGRHRDLRLEQDLDLASIERPAQIDLEPLAAFGLGFGAFLEHPHRRAFAGLGFGERHAGAAQQQRGVVARLRDRDAGAAAEGDHMVAGHERPADRLDQLAGELPAVAGPGGRRDQHGEFGPRHAGDEDAPPVRVHLALDPTRRRLEHGIAHRPPKGGIDRVVAADREQEHDDRSGFGLPGELGFGPGTGGAAVGKAGQRVAAARLAALVREDGLGAPDNVALGLDPDMVGDSAHRPRHRHGRRPWPRRSP